MTDDYESLGALLAGMGLLVTAAEVHGVVCGQLCASTADYSAVLTVKILGADSPDARLGVLLDELAADTVDRLTETGSFSFTPLLPDDDEDLGLRLYALSRWCEGYTLGYAAGCSAGGTALPEEAREVLADFSRIAEVDTADDEADDEADYTEVLEYVRVAAASLYRGRDDESSAVSDDTVH